MAAPTRRAGRDGFGHGDRPPVPGQQPLHKVGSPLLADEGQGRILRSLDPQSIAFWGRGVGGEWEFSIPDRVFEEGLDLAGLTEVQVWIVYKIYADPRARLPVPLKIASLKNGKKEAALH